MKILVTGGAGFIGSNFIHQIINNHPDDEIVNLDKLTYAGNLENLKSLINEPRYSFVKGDITDRNLVNSILRNKFDVLVNFAAESHVDRSIADSTPFVETNIKGTQVLLEGIRHFGIGKYIQISTDEVYGSNSTGLSNENSPLAPNSPYAASKTSADLICRSYYITYQLPVIIIRCSNNYGPYQFPEKLIPLVVSRALSNQEIPVYGDGMNVREWIFVEDCCRALDLVARKGVPGEIYNAGSGVNKNNLELVKYILGILGKPETLIKFVNDRPGHDYRYALDSSKIRKELDWSPLISFEDGLLRTVKWYLENDNWFQYVKNGGHVTYYSRMYASR